MNLKGEFVRQMERLLPPEEAGLLMDALGAAPEVSVRLNGRKAAGLSVVGGERVTWCGEGYYLPSRPQFTFDPLLHAGVYYVQDASSMFIGHVLRRLAGETPVAYLDLCAAPGGKTTAAIDALPEGSLIVCNEIDRTRAQILRENVVKWGSPNCVVANDGAAAFGKMKGLFDIVAADMPCSGEGMFRKDEEAVRQWSPGLVADCAARQAEIASAVWDALRPGGLFVYSTCTFNREENEKMADYVADRLGAEPVEVTTDTAWRIRPGIGTAKPCYRFMPHSTRGEGLFVAVLRKSGDASSKRVEKQTGKHVGNLSVPSSCRGFLLSADRFELSADGEGEITALPLAHIAKIRQIERFAKVICKGVHLASVKGKSVVPAYALALSSELRADAFPSVDADYRQAIAFLRGEAVSLPQGAPLGHTLVRYKGYPLGFVKNLGSRANNCYPKEWRIRSAFAPDDAPCVVAMK